MQMFDNNKSKYVEFFEGVKAKDFKNIVFVSENARDIFVENLKNDKEFIIELVKEARNVYPLLDEAYRNDKDIAIVISQVWPYAMKYMGESLRKDMDVILSSVEANSGQYRKY